ncbi:MAG: glycosyltransferase family 4 protein [Prevotella sp.]|nr:glycosyltransferase family 4 protein [Prevotella sp.]
MHILISAQTYPSPKNQLSAFVAVLAEEMVRQGEDVTVLAPQSLTTCWRHKIPLCPQKYKAKISTSEGIREMTIFRPYSFSLGQGRFYKISIQIDRFVINRAAKRLKIRPDIIYSHFWKAADNIIDYAVKNGIPSFVATGEDEITIDKYFSAQRVILLNENTKGVICVSTKNQEESIAHHLTEKSRTIVQPNAVNHKEFYPIGRKTARERLGYSQDDFIVAFCGRFNTRKGCRRVSDAITLLNDPLVKSIFIGIASGGIHEEPECEGILFKGSLNHNEIVTYLNAADVFVLPTQAEGCSNAIIEAMACGLPIISSNLPFNYDILNESNAILVDPMNVRQIADAIKEIKKNPERQQSMSATSLETAKKLSIENRVSSILEFIKKQINSHNK